MDEYIEKHLIDILNAATEVESYFADAPKRFQDFQNDMLRQRAVERNVEIMGEAINRILKHDPDFILSNSRAIIATRNRVIHGYDSVTTEFIWSLVIRHIPALKKDVEEILGEVNDTTLNAVRELKTGKVTRCESFDDYLTSVKK